MGVATPATGQPTCGGTVGPGGTVTMTADIVACAVDAALRVGGTVVLDMAGHLVTCDANAPFVVGLAVEGRGTTVRNGTVGGCAFPVAVAGDGQHKIRNVMVFRARQHRPRQQRRPGRRQSRLRRRPMEQRPRGQGAVLHPLTLVAAAP